MKKKRIIIIMLAIIAAAIIAFVLAGLHNKSAVEKSNVTGSINPTLYTMDLTLDTEKDNLAEVVQMEFSNDTDAPATEICIREMAGPGLVRAADIDPKNNKDKKSQITSIRMAGDDEPLEYSMQDENSTVRVSIPEEKAVQPGETGVLEVEMNTDIPNIPDRFGVRTVNGHKIYMLSFCFPYISDNNDGNWENDPYFYDGESRSYDLAAYDITFHAPDNYVTIASGTEEDIDGGTKIHAEEARDIGIVTSDAFEVDRFDVNGVKVNSYYFQSKNSDEFREISELAARDSIKTFTEEIGPCTTDEIDLVETAFDDEFYGMEYAGLCMNDGSHFYDEDCEERLPEELAMTVAHEIGHQWFYDAIGNREYTEGWLDEGFTTYLEKDLYYYLDTPSVRLVRGMNDKLPSVEELKKEDKEYKAEVKSENKTLYLNEAPNEYLAPEEISDNYGDREYDGGYFFLTDVRDILGEEAFSQFLKEYYETNKMKVVTSDDVIQLVEKYDDSKEMKQVLAFYFKGYK